MKPFTFCVRRHSDWQAARILLHPVLSPRLQKQEEILHRCSVDYSKHLENNPLLMRYVTESVAVWCQNFGPKV